MFAVMLMASLQIFGMEKSDTISLNEKWLFKLMKCESEVPAGFASTYFNDSQWLFMNIPAQWDVKHPQDWDGFNHVGIYRGWVKLLPKWRNKKIMLHIGNTTSEADVFINGNFVGKTSKTLATSEFDITSFLHKGRNLYTFKMKSWDEDVETAANAWTPGITSDCYIYTVPMRLRDLMRDSAGVVLDSLSVLTDSLLLADSLRWVADSLEADSLAQVADSLDSIASIQPRVMKVLVADRNCIEHSKGYVDDRKHMLESIRMLKYLNFNAVSYNKSSSDPLFMRLCRENGLRVVEEPPTFEGRLINDEGEFTYLAFEAIHCNQYINGVARDLRQGKFVIVNNDTVSQERTLRIAWTLYVDGKVTRQGELPNQTFVSKGRKEISFPRLLADVPADKEALLNMQYHDQADNAILGFDMFTVQPYGYMDVIEKKKSQMAMLMEKTKPKLKSKDGVLDIFEKEGGFRVLFDEATGFLTDYVFGGKRYLASLVPNEEVELTGFSHTKFNKKLGVDVTAIYARKADGRLFILTYHISPCGVLTISANVDLEMKLTFPRAFVNREYYAKDEFRPILSSRLTEETDRVRWCRQSTPQGTMAWVVTEEEYQLKPTEKPTEMVVGPLPKGGKLYILPQ